MAAPQDDLADVRVLRQARRDFLKTIGGLGTDAIPDYETIADDRLRAMVRNGAVAVQVRQSWENLRAAAAAAGVPPELMQLMQFPPNPPARVLQSGPERAELMNTLAAIGAWENTQRTPPPPPPDPWPEFMSSAAMAKRLGMTEDAVNGRLSRLRKKYPDCCMETDQPKKGEPHILYRVSEVLPTLQK